MIDSDELLLAMRNVESDPFSVLKHSEIDPVIIHGYMDHIKKYNLRKVMYDPKLYDDLQHYYTETIGEAIPRNSSAPTLPTSTAPSNSTNARSIPKFSISPWTLPRG